MQFLYIVLLSIAAAVLYGIAHDQVTVRVCPEYFTLGHPQIVATTDPTLLAIAWGVVATWWVGLLLGVPLAVVSLAGSRPQRSIESLVRPIAFLLAIMAVCALLAGIAGWILARNDVVFLVGPLADILPPDFHPPFIADLWAHLASYATGFLGGIVVLIQVWRSRKHLDG